MGLDLHSSISEATFYYGPFPTVHATRKEVIQAAIKYLESKVPEKKTKRRKSHEAEERAEDLKKTIAELKTWIEFEGMPELLAQMLQVNYGVLPQSCPDSLNVLGLAGVYYFVKHSDSDGSWSQGNLLDIIGTLMMVDQFLPPRGEFWNDLECFLNKVSEDGGAVIFC